MFINSHLIYFIYSLLGLHPNDIKPPIIPDHKNEQTVQKALNQPKDLSYNNEMNSEYQRRITQLENDRATLKEQLVISEEERMKLTRALASLKSKYDQIRDLVDTDKYDVGDKIGHIENDLEETNQIMNTVNELHEKLRILTEERNKMEEEMLAFRDNNQNLTRDLDRMTSDFNAYKLNAENELYNTKEVLNSTKNEIDFLHSEIEKFKKIQSDLLTEIDEREVQYKRQLEDREREIELKMFELAQSEKRKLESDLREANRKIEDLSEENNDFNRITDELRKEKNKLELQNDQMRKSTREIIAKGLDDKKDNKVDINGLQINPNNKQLLIKTYKNREDELSEMLKIETAKAENLKQKVKKLRTYSRKLRNIALDYFPVKDQLPEVLTKDVNIFLEDAENESVVQFLVIKAH